MHLFEVTLLLARFRKLGIAEMRDHGPSPFGDHLVQPSPLQRVTPSFPPDGRPVIPGFPPLSVPPPRTEGTPRGHPRDPRRLSRTPVRIRRPIDARPTPILRPIHVGPPVIDHAPRIRRAPVIALGGGDELPQVALDRDDADGFRQPPIARSDDLVILVPCRLVIRRAPPYARVPPRRAPSPTWTMRPHGADRILPQGGLQLRTRRRVRRVPQTQLDLFPTRLQGPIE